MCLESFAEKRHALSMVRSSVVTHPKHLEAQSLVKGEIPQGSVGRPKMLCKPSPKPLGKEIRE